jgi:hypothetical protein
MSPNELFRAAVKSPFTRDPYERRLIPFLSTVGLTPYELIEAGKQDPYIIEKKIISFISREL